MNRVSQLIANRYNKFHFQKIQDLEGNLSQTLDIIELWREMQRGWRYLDNIFGSGGDIKK